MASTGSPALVAVDVMVALPMNGARAWRSLCDAPVKRTVQMCMSLLTMHVSVHVYEIAAARGRIKLQLELLGMYIYHRAVIALALQHAGGCRSCFRRPLRHKRAQTKATHAHHASVLSGCTHFWHTV